MRLSATIALAGVVLLATAAWAAEKDAPADVEALIQKGLKAYKDGKVRDSVSALQEAIAAMQKSQEKGLAAFFPKAPAGFEAGKIESQSASYGDGASATSYTILKQTFTRASDDVTATVTLTDAPQMIEAQKARAEAYRNPGVMAALNQSPDTKVTLIDQNGWVGWKIISKGHDAQIAAYSGSTLLQVNLSKDDANLLDAFWNAIDLKGLASAQTKPAATK